MKDIILCGKCSQPNSVYDKRCVRCGHPINHEGVDLDGKPVWS